MSALTAISDQQSAVRNRVAPTARFGAAEASRPCRAREAGPKASDCISADDARSTPVAAATSAVRATRTVRIALLGCGTVGACVARQLIERRAEIGEKTGLDLQLQSILVRDPDRDRGIAFDSFTNSFDRVLAARPDLIIELLGGVEPAAEYIRRAVESGISVVTANKTVIARRGGELRDLARRSGARLEYEAAVCAAVPILSSLRTLGADRVYSLKGIVNGSTNYILTRMDDNGVSMTEALAEARERGLIEPDPTADLSGRDAAEKLCILAHEVGCTSVSLDDIEVHGIESITTEDVLFARRQGFALRLVAELEVGAGGRTLRVGPALLPRSHPLARVRGEDNGILVRSHVGGDLFLAGKGAGPAPTTSAILGDVLRVVRTGAQGHARIVQRRPSHASPAPSTPNPYFLRVICDGGHGPAALFESMRQNGVAVKSVDVRAGAARIMTHPTTAAQVRHVLREVGCGRPDPGLIAPVLHGGVLHPVIAAPEQVERKRIA